MFRFPKVHSLDYKKDITSARSQMIFRLKQIGYKSVNHMTAKQLKDTYNKVS